MGGATELSPYLAAAVWPEPLSDETLYSLVAHTSRLNGWPSEREVCAHLFGDHGSMRLGDVRVDLDRFVAVTRGAYGDAAGISAQMTNAAFFSGLGSRPDIEVPRPWEPGTLGTGKEPEYPGLATLSNGQAHIWRWCPECNDEDLRDNGRVYWRRTHQLPGVFVCIRHRRPILEVNMPYRVRQQHLYLPDSLPGALVTKAACPPDTDLSLAQALAEFAVHAMEDAPHEHAPAVVHGAIVDGLLEAGLISKGGKVRRQEFSEALTGFYRGLVGVEAVALQLNTQRLNTLTRALTGSVQSLPAMLNLMLALWLFGSWELFCEHCLWRGAIDTRETVDLRCLPSGDEKATENDKKSPRTRHRQACMDFLHALPEATRTDFWKQNPRSCRWLIQYDSRWMNTHLPLEKTSITQPCLFDN